MDIQLEMSAHSKGTSYTCSACGKAFKQKGNFIEHMRVHTGERPYECSLCHKAFSHSSSLASHKKIHSDATPHKCSFCMKSFKHKSDLTKHQRMHLCTYSCSVCHMTFLYKSNLSRHIESHKNRTITESHSNEAKDPKEISLRCQSHQSTAYENRADDEGLTRSSSTSNETSYPRLHSSEVPFIINVKQEEDM